MVVAGRGAGVQQHLEDAKKGAAGEGGCRDRREVADATHDRVLVSKESKDEHANGERASKRSLVLRRCHVAVAVIVCSSSP